MKKNSHKIKPTRQSFSHLQINRHIKLVVDMKVKKIPISGYSRVKCQEGVHKQHSKSSHPHEVSATHRKGGV